MLGSFFLSHQTLQWLETFVSWHDTIALSCYALHRPIDRCFELLFVLDRLLLGLVFLPSRLSWLRFIVALEILNFEIKVATFVLNLRFYLVLSNFRLFVGQALHEFFHGLIFVLHKDLILHHLATSCLAWWILDHLITSVFVVHTRYAL